MEDGDTAAHRTGEEDGMATITTDAAIFCAATRIDASEAEWAIERFGRCDGLAESGAPWVLLPAEASDELILSAFHGEDE